MNRDQESAPIGFKSWKGFEISRSMHNARIEREDITPEDLQRAYRKEEAAFKRLVKELPGIREEIRRVTAEWIRAAEEGRDDADSLDEKRDRLLNRMHWLKLHWTDAESRASDCQCVMFRKYSNDDWAAWYRKDKERQCSQEKT